MSGNELEYRLAMAGDNYEDGMYTDQDWIDAQIAEIEELAAERGCVYRGVSNRDDGAAALLFVWRNETYENYFTTGFCQSLEQAIDFTKALFETHDTEDILMNIFKNDKLFPNIRGVMLKEKRVTLTMNGKVNVVEMRDGNDARVEIFFADHTKSAVINRTQAMDIADVYGPETGDWANKPLVLYGEHGKWFGRETWGVRVDKDATERAWKKAQRAAKSNGTIKQEDIRGDNSPEAQKAREDKRPTKQNEPEPEPTPFYDKAVDAIPFFSDVAEVEAAMAANELEIPETEENETRVMATLNQYANLLADGTDAADAVKLLQGELALDETEAA